MTFLSGLMVQVLAGWCGGGFRSLVIANDAIGEVSDVCVRQIWFKYTRVDGRQGLVLEELPFRRIT